MTLQELQEKLNIPKVPTHPNKSTMDEWLDIYEDLSRLPDLYGFKKQLLAEVKQTIQQGLAGQGLDDHKHYVIKMFLRDIDEVIVRRRSVKNKRKNAFLSRMAKQRWRRYRSKYQRSLGKFHRSSKGKDFHKALGRMLKRASAKKENVHQDEVSWRDVTDEDLVQLMLSINSALTHMLIEYETKYKEGDGYEYYDDFDPSLLQFSVELVGQMLTDLSEAMAMPPDERWDTVHDVLYLAADVFIASGIEVDYDWEEVE